MKTMPSHIKCPSCRVWNLLCFCAEIKVQKLPLPSHLVMNVSEYQRATNSGHLLHQIFPDIKLVLRGGSADPMIITDLIPVNKIPLILFPSDEAEVLPLERHPDHELVILDGNWSQGKKIANRWKSHPNVRFVKLPPAPAWDVYHLRTNPHTDRLCTFEAAIKALSVWDPHLDRDYAFRLLKNFNYSFQWMYGRLGPKAALPPLSHGLNKLNTPT